MQIRKKVTGYQDFRSWEAEPWRHVNALLWQPRVNTGLARTEDPHDPDLWDLSPFFFISSLNYQSKSIHTGLFVHLPLCLFARGLVFYFAYLVFVTLQGYHIPPQWVRCTTSNPMQLRVAALWQPLRHPWLHVTIERAAIAYESATALPVPIPVFPVDECLRPPISPSHPPFLKSLWWWEMAAVVRHVYWSAIPKATSQRWVELKDECDLRGADQIM